MCNGVTCYTINAGGSVNLVGAVNVTQHFCCNLSRSGFLARHGGGKRKNAACAEAQHSANNSLLAHAEADERMPVTLLLQELHHDHVVVQRGGGAHDFVEVGLQRFHSGKSLFQLLGGTEIMVGKD